jgi:ABC-2 type transport system permease protein
MHLKTKMQYKVSFILTTISQFIAVGMDIFVIYSLFEKFGLLKGYKIFEVLISFGVVYLGYGIAEFLGRGFDHFKNLIVRGTFDLILIRPRNIFLQIAGSEIGYEKISKITCAIVVMIYALIKTNITFTIENILILLLMILGSIFIFLSIFIMGATLCFITIQGLEIVNVFSDGTRQIGQYPMGIYKKEILIFFTFVIPLACINYYPVLYITGKSSNILFALSPLLGILFILPAIFIFNIGLRKYKSSGS